MPRRDYVSVLERPSCAPIYQNGWRPIKPKLYAKLAVGVGAARRQLHGNVKPRAPAATPQEPLVRIHVDPAPWAHNFELPAWNVDFPDAARRHLENFADMLTARSARGGWGTAFPLSLVLESALISLRKLKTHEESTEPTIFPPTAAHAKTENERTHILASSVLIKVEKSRAKKVEESRLTVCPIITSNMKLLDDMLWYAHFTAAIDFSAPVLIAKSATSLNRPIKNFQPSSLVRRSERSNIVVVMIEDDYIDFPPVIAGYVPWGLHAD